MFMYYWEPIEDGGSMELFEASLEISEFFFWKF
jgi:hypothetical protein